MAGTISTLPRATRRAQVRLAVALVTPAVILVVVFFLYPLASAIYYSLIDFNGVDPSPPFVGLSNYVQMFQDPEVWHALRNNLIWIVIGTISPIVIGFVLALMIWSVRRGARIYRLMFFLPYVLPGIAIGIIWSWIYDPISGWLNLGLRAIGAGHLATGWLGNPSTALLAVLATAIWGATGFAMLVFVSGLQNVDLDLVDAARLDRANSVQRAWHVIVPQMTPIVLMVTTVTLVGGFSVFDIVFIMTGGGPDNASDVLGTYAYTNAFQLNKISYGTTIAILLTALSVPCAVGINALQRRLSLEGRGV